MKIKPLLVSAILVSMTSIATTDTQACSNVFVLGGNAQDPNSIRAVVARNMDFAQQMGNKFGYGARGLVNTSDINMPQSSPVTPLTWTNKYAFAGQTPYYSVYLNDGVNTEGLYVGLLQMSDFTSFPVYNPKDPRPELGVLDAVNYALGTSASVKEALSNFKNAQFVVNAGVEGNTIMGFPFHLVLRDKSGDSAVIEWVDGKTHYYYHQAFTKTVQETIDGALDGQVYPDTNGAILTNAPTYGWHLQNYAKSGFSSLYNGNSDQLVDGGIQGGSGLNGVPGDFTPASRFLRGTVLLDLAPETRTTDEAVFVAIQTIESLKVPVGAGPGPTMWQSLVDLPTSTYYFRAIINPDTNQGNQSLALPSTRRQLQWKTVKVKQLHQTPAGWINIKSVQGRPLTGDEASTVMAEINARTPANIRVKTAFSP